jgi:cell division protein FtsX
MIYAPLNSAFMATSIIGFLVSALYIMKFSQDWGLSFTILFTLMFIASIISMIRSDVYTNDVDQIAIKELKKRK